MQNLKTTGEVMERFSVPRHRIIYAIESGVIAQPEKIGGRRFFNETAVTKLEQYFEKKRLNRLRKQRGGCVSN